MMNNLNSVLLEGNLTKDPQEKSIEGTTLSNFSIACNRYYKKDKEQVQETSYFNIDVWGKTAEYCNQYLKKGSGVRIIGRLKQDRWLDSEDTTRSTIKIIAEHVDFLRYSRKSSSQKTSSAQDDVQEIQEQDTADTEDTEIPEKEIISIE